MAVVPPNLIVLPDPVVHADTVAKEECDTYVHLIRKVRGVAKNSVRVRVTVDGNGVSHDQRDYFKTDQHHNMPSTLPFRIRIPALMFIRSGQMVNKTLAKEDYKGYFRDSTQCRQQFGSHLYASQLLGANMVNLMIVSTYWSPTNGQIATWPRQYRTTAPTPICSVYPCYKQGPTNAPNDLRMVLGTCFVDLDDHPYYPYQPRTYGRFFVDNGVIINRSAFDIPESFIDVNEQPQVGVRFWNNFQNGNDPLQNPNNLGLFPRIVDKNANAMAFYVCRGARLTVRDSRFPIDGSGYHQMEEDLAPGQDFGHCRSLYMQGSLCVVKGSERMVVPIRRYSATNTEGVDHGFFFQQFLESHSNPNRSYNATRIDNVEMGLDPDRNILRYLLNKVIFLGAVESQYNSVCWNIRIERGADDENHHMLKLTIPEGGVIVDISSWRAGFNQIYWRHKYERLYESVLIPNVPLQNEHLPFQVPNQYWHKRILELPNRVQRHNLDPNNTVALKLYSTTPADRIPRVTAQGVLEDAANNNIANDRDVRRYIAKLPYLFAGLPNAHLDLRMRYVQWYTQRPDLIPDLDWPVPTPSLYPPIMMKVSQNPDVFKLVYLANDDKVVSVKGKDGRYGNYFNTWKNPNQYYTLIGNNGFKAYPWCSQRTDLLHRMHVVYGQDHIHEKDQMIRLGMDYKEYYKWAGCPIGVGGRGRGRAFAHNDNIQKKISTWCLNPVDPNQVPNVIDQTEQIVWNNLYF